MIRWRYIIPRVFIVVAIFLVLRYTLAPVAKYLTVKAIGAATGARVDIASVDVGFFPPTLRYTAVAVANPRASKSLNNLVEAEEIQCVIDGRALLNRRYVIREARVSGLVVGGKRETDGHIDREPVVTSPSDRRWLSDLTLALADQTESQLSAIADQSEIVRRSDQIRRRWKIEYAELTRRADELEASIRSIQASAKAIDNPLRDWPKVEASLAQAKKIQEELIEVRATLDALPGRVQSDLALLQQAKQIDIDRVRDRLPLDATATDGLGPQLLAGMVKSQIDRVRGYLESGREVADWTVAAPKAERLRGEWIDLTRGPRPPSVLVRRCEIAGAFRAEGETYQLAGLIENLTPQPRLADEPLRARLRLDGPQSVRVEMTRNDAVFPRQETLTLHWPDLKAPDVRLGESDSIELEMVDGRMELWVQLDSTGDRMHGRLVSRRVDTAIELRSDTRIADTPMVATLRNTLAGIDRVEVDAGFRGTWDNFDVTVSTNVTAILRNAMRQALAAQIESTRVQAHQQIDQIYEGQIGELQEWLATQQSAARNQLAKADSTIQDISRKVIQETGSAEAYLGRLRGTFR